LQLMLSTTLIYTANDNIASGGANRGADGNYLLEIVQSTS